MPVLCFSLVQQKPTSREEIVLPVKLLAISAIEMFVSLAIFLALGVTNLPFKILSPESPANRVSLETRFAVND